ncbi:RHS repeat-associated core domain-containing protein [Zhongshania borealis]
MDETAAGISNTVFVGGLYEKVTLPNGDIKERHYVGGNTIVTYKNRTANSAGTTETRYLHKDHIGSTVLISDENGDEVESFSFDPWGKRRAATLTEIQAILGSWSSLTVYQKGNLTISALTLSSDITNKGFTGHEQLDGVNLIHMGGRVYDAEIGRFLSADPFVGDSTNLQALNRYSYVENNPLSYTDPSGFFLKKLVKKIGNAIGKAHKAVAEAFLSAHKKFFREIGRVEGLSTAISIGLGIVCNGAAAACVAAFNAAMTAANGGTIEQVITGAAVGYIAGEFSTQLGVAFNAGNVGNVGAAMFVGGSVAKAQGGKFIDGVKGAAVGAAIGYGIQRIMSPTPELAGAESGDASLSENSNELMTNDELNVYMSDYLDGSSGQYVAQLDLPLAPQWLVDSAAGFGDTLSFGGTAIAREIFGYNDVVNFGSGAYMSGVGAGTAVHMIGFRTGGELNIGRNFRLAPWGNRTGHPTGKYPHYHRRAMDGKGNTVPGGSIKRHRPWDSRSSDKSMGDRF